MAEVTTRGCNAIKTLTNNNQPFGSLISQSRLRVKLIGLLMDPELSMTQDRGHARRGNFMTQNQGKTLEIETR